MALLSSVQPHCAILLQYLFQTVYNFRKGVNPKHVYLDGVRGYVVRAQGAKAVNRVSFKWSFVMDKKISRYSYHHSVVLRSEVRTCPHYTQDVANL